MAIDHYHAIAVFQQLHTIDVLRCSQVCSTSWLMGKDHYNDIMPRKQSQLKLQKDTASARYKSHRIVVEVYLHPLFDRPSRSVLCADSSQVSGGEPELSFQSLQAQKNRFRGTSAGRYSIKRKVQIKKGKRSKIKRIKEKEKSNRKKEEGRCRQMGRNVGIAQKRWAWKNKNRGRPSMYRSCYVVHYQNYMYIYQMSSSINECINLPTREKDAIGQQPHRCKMEPSAFLMQQYLSER